MSSHQFVCAFCTEKTVPVYSVVALCSACEAQFLAMKAITFFTYRESGNKIVRQMALTYLVDWQTCALNLNKARSWQSFFIILPCVFLPSWLCEEVFASHFAIISFTFPETKGMVAAKTQDQNKIPQNDTCPESESSFQPMALKTLSDIPIPFLPFVCCLCKVCLPFFSVTWPNKGTNLLKSYLHHS